MIKNATDIREAAKAEIVPILTEAGLQLKKQGANFIACCPFHSEKTPSFTVFPATGTYKCFGCGEAGDPISFLIDSEGMTFPEAIERAAAVLKKTIEYDAKGDFEGRRKEERERKSRREALSVQAENVLKAWQERGLPQTEITWATSLDDKLAQIYIRVAGRWFPKKELDKWGIAYAPNDNFITQKMTAEQWPAVLLQELKLINTSADRTFDYFRDRIIFPIYDYRKTLVGFGGRRTETNNHPAKYINSADSLLYTKSKVLYGIHKARRHIVRENNALVVEGYTDVISLHIEGLKNSVSCCGTSFTQEQAELLRRFTATVTFVKDGDRAGLDSMKRDVDVALKGRLIPKVVQLPLGHDPDSLIRRVGGAAFSAYIKAEQQDGIIWRIMQEWSEDIHQQLIAIEYAAELLLMLPDDIAREAYLKKLTHKSRMGAVTKELRAAMEKKETAASRAGKRHLSADQAQDIIKYGFFERNNAYWACSDPDGFDATKISNFVIEPVMLVKSRQESRRLVRIKNELGQSFVADVESKIFSNFRSFSDFVEENGNYLFLESAKPPHHIKIKRKLYRVMPPCFPIYTMGLHKEGFWTWSNGIITPQGDFLQTDNNGLVDYKDTRYYLPAHSDLENEVMSDDDEETNVDQKNFMYINIPKTIDFTEWTAQLRLVHRENGMVAAAWFCAALYRDIIYPKVNCFPHLFCFGPPRSGKSYTAWSLQYMFGAVPKGPTHFVQATDAAFFRSFSWVRNGVTWIDEYGNEGSFERVESLKMAYDGTGREKAKGGYGHTITRTPINSGVLISGQQQPTQDIALMTRCILLSYPKREFSREEEENADNLREIEQTGCLTQITAQLQKYRPMVEKHFSTFIDKKKSILRSTLQGMGVKIDSRLLLNYCIITGVADILASHCNVRFGYSLQELEEYCLDLLVSQCDSIDNQDETAIFWNIITFLISKKIVLHNEDIIVEPKVKERFRDEADRSSTKETRELSWEEDRVLVYLNMTKVHQEYLERHQKTRNKPGLDIKALLYYLRGSDAYLGEKRGKKFNGRTRSCLVFDRDLLPVELLLTAEETGEAESPDFA